MTPALKPLSVSAMLYFFGHVNLSGLSQKQTG
jgi:hypothetical protein